MKAPKPIIAYGIDTGNATRFISMNDFFRQLGLSAVYAASRLNTGKCAKRWLLYDTAHAYTADTIAHVRKLSPAFDEAFDARENQPEHEVSVRIDSKTIILVKASKWTPDYADRYRAKMEASRPQSHTQGFRVMNDTIKAPTSKRGPGRPRKGEK